jgi:hypothetical protein
MTDETMSRDNEPVVEPEVAPHLENLPDDWDEEDEDFAEAERALFELLRRGGYDRVEVGYEAKDELNVRRVAFFKGGVEVENKPLVEELRGVAEAYLSEVLPDQWGYDEGCYGTAYLYPASGYVKVAHVELIAEYESFTLGVPGPDVPEDDRW